MKLNVKLFVWRTALIGAVIGSALAAFGGLHQAHPMPQGYDNEASLERLRRIGAALQIYREAHPPLEVADRRSPADAGLPPSMLHLTKPGHAWSISPLDFRVPKPSPGNERLSSHFSLLYWADGTLPSSMKQWFAARGEELPILADFNSLLLTVPDQNGEYEVPILRLNGQVKIVRYDPKSQIAFQAK
jgi:hypothetical protein